MRHTVWLALALGVGAVVILAALQPAHTYWPEANAADRAALETKVQEAEQLLGDMVITGDVTRLEHVFVDHPDYAIDDEARAVIRRQLGEAALPGAGFLTARRAFVLEQHQAHGIAAPYFERAESEGRALTEAERTALLRALGPLPWPGIVYTGTDFPPVYTFDLVRVQGDRAVVEYDNGSTYNRATLIRTDGRWFVTGLFLIRSHL